MPIGITMFAQDRLLNKEDFDKEMKPLTDKVNSLQSENSKLKSEIGTLKVQLSNTTKSIDSLRNKTQANSQAINQARQELGLKITTTETNSNKKITEVSESLSKNTLYGIIAVLSAILLSGLLYWLLRKKQKEDQTDVIAQLSQTKSAIEESLIKEFGKQTELMEAQLKVLESQKQTQQMSPTNSEPDYSLALKVADEITLMERNISHMDADTKGLKQLARSIMKLKDNLNANGYDMPELLGKPFNQGMKVIVASSIPDENLEKGVKRITKIIKPQVNYNEKMIQTAQIEISVGD